MHPIISSRHYLGPNGSGKSTTQKILTGILKGHGGKVSLFGQDISAAHGPEFFQKIGVLFEFPYLYANGRLVTVEVSAEVAECLEEGRHKDENFRHEQRRHWDNRELDT